MAVAVLLLALPVATLAAEAPLERVTRSGFAMDMPSWRIEADEDQGAHGQHARAGDTLRADVRWTLDGQVDAADLDIVIGAMEHGFQARRIERRVEQPPGQLRLFSLLEMDNGTWLAVTHAACRDAGVLVTISVTAPDRLRATSLHDAMLATFACRAADLPPLVDAWPTTDLPDAFGVFMQGSPILAHRDGRWLMIGKLAPATIGKIAADPERARQAFAVYGDAMEADWEVQTEATGTRNLSGPAFTWDLDSPVLGAVSASAFVCGNGASGYVVFAGNFSGSSDVAPLRTLGARLGCPDLALPSVLQRRSACEAGVTDFCE